jgi:hypothetical protein
VNFGDAGGICLVGDLGFSSEMCLAGVYVSVKEVAGHAIFVLLAKTGKQLVVNFEINKKW